jgi:hypothetical protein
VRFLAGIFLALLLVPNLCGAANNSGMRFIWAGNVGQKYTDAQVANMANNYDYVVIPKWHAKWNMDPVQLQEVARIKAINPNVKVLCYWSGFHLYPQFSQVNVPKDHENWYVHDFNGNRLLFAQKYFWADVSNANFRKWALGILGNWMEVFDGVAFDESHIWNVSLNGDTQIRKLKDQIGDAKLRQLNSGIRDLFDEAVAAFPGKIFAFNGIENWPYYYQRSKQLLSRVHVGVNEDFTYFKDSFLPKAQTLQYINMMSDPQHTEKLFFQKTNVITPVSERKREQIGRYSFGSFLLGYQPGRSFYKFGFGRVYTVSAEIDHDPPEVLLDFGAPIDSFNSIKEGVYHRQFANGEVFVNMDTVKRKITIPTNGVIMNGGIPGETISAGQIRKIPPHDALFVLY